MRSNLQVSFFDLKVRHRGSQPSIFVRTFRSFTTTLVIIGARRKVGGDQEKAPHATGYEAAVQSRQHAPGEQISGGIVILPVSNRYVDIVHVIQQHSTHEQDMQVINKRQVLALEHYPCLSR